MLFGHVFGKDVSAERLRERFKKLNGRFVCAAAGLRVEHPLYARANTRRNCRNARETRNENFRFSKETFLCLARTTYDPDNRWLLFAAEIIEIQDRLHDLRMIADDENAALTFSNCVDAV